MSSQIDSRRRFRSLFYERFIIHHREWLHRLVARYKERGLFPSLPYDIAHYYSDHLDKEVALFAALIIKYNGKEQQQIQSIRRIIGEHPRQWLANREFVPLSYGSMRDIYINGSHFITYSRFALLMEHASRIISKISYDYSDFEPLMAESLGVYKKDVQLLMMILCTNDCIGLGLHKAKNIQCPETEGVVRFAKNLMPDYQHIYTIKDIIELQGLEKPFDFLYATWAWEELCRLCPKECSRYISVFQKRYLERSEIERKYWCSNKYGILPEIII